MKKFALIIGAKPSQGARSPKLWNKVYKKKKINCKMYPADVKNSNLKNLVSILKKNKNFIGGSVTVPHKEKIVKSIRKIGHENVNIFKDENNMENELLNISKDNDFIIFLGAGAISKKARSLEKNMLKLIEKNKKI